MLVSWYQRKNIHRHTWISNDGQTQKEIDHTSSQYTVYHYTAVYISRRPMYMWHVHCSGFSQSTIAFTLFLTFQNFQYRSTTMTDCFIHECNRSIKADRSILCELERPANTVTIVSRSFKLVDTAACRSDDVETRSEQSSSIHFAIDLRVMTSLSYWCVARSSSATSTRQDWTTIRSDHIGSDRLPQRTKCVTVWGTANIARKTRFYWSSSS